MTQTQSILFVKNWDEYAKDENNSHTFPPSRPEEGNHIFRVKHYIKCSSIHVISPTSTSSI